MPVITIQLIEGRDKDTKRRLIEGVADTVCDVLNKEPESLRVILQEIPATDYAIGRTPMSDKK